MLAFELMDVTMARQMMQWWVCRGEIYIIINMYFSLVIRDSLFKSVAYTENTNSSNLLSKCLTINDPKREVQLPEVTAIEIKDVPHVHPHVCPIMAVPNSTQFVLQLGGHVSMQLGRGVVQRLGPQRENVRLLIIYFRWRVVVSFILYIRTS